MGNTEIRVQFSESEFAALSFMSQRLEVTIPDLIRNLVPRLHGKLVISPTEVTSVVPQAKGPF